MSKGSPNDATRKLNFVAKVWDAKYDNGDGSQGAYRPLYIAPEATDQVLGDVYLSDAIDSSDNASTGVTAATPYAVKQVSDKLPSKLDKIDSEKQTVASDVDFSGTIFAQNGMSVGENSYFTGNLRGNADTASKLTPGKTITISGSGTGNNSGLFTGESDLSLILDTLDVAKLNGIVPVEKGGTGKGTIKGATNSLLGSTETISEDINDDSLLMGLYSSPTDETGAVWKTTAGSLWDFYKTKTDSLYADINHTHSVFSTTRNGFVPHPDSESGLFLRDDGTWGTPQIEGAVTGVKGSEETDYRTGEVNITSENVGVYFTSDEDFLAYIHG